MKIYHIILCCFCFAAEAKVIVLNKTYDFGAWFHLDAASADSLVINTQNGTNFVTRWNDWRGNGLYASQTIATNSPFISDELNEKPTLSFGRTFNASSLPGGDKKSLSFSQRNTEIRSGVLVFREENLETMAFLLGDTSLYHFHSGTLSKLFHSTYTSHNLLLSKQVKVDKNTITPWSYVLSPGWHIVSFVTTNGPVTASTLCQDRNLNYGGNSYAEILIFTNYVSETIISEVESYLSDKWGISVPDKSFSPSPISTIHQGKGFQPTDINDCEVWLDANDRNTVLRSSVDQTVCTNNEPTHLWLDKSGKNNHFTNNVSENSVLSFTNQNHNVLRFNNTDNINGFIPVQSLTNTTFFFVANPLNDQIYLLYANNTAPYQNFWAAYNGYYNDFYNVAQMGNPVWYNDGNIKPSWNRTTVYLDTRNRYSIVTASDLKFSTWVTPKILRFNGAGGYAWTGYFAELIIYNRVLSTSERRRVESYLSNKWNIPLYNNPSKEKAPKTVSAIYQGNTLIHNPENRDYLRYSGIIYSPERDFKYVVTGGKATITGYTGRGGQLNIPPTLGGYPTTYIGNSAFRNNITITQVRLPDSLTSIAGFGFGKSNITKVILGSGITFIDNYAFWSCSLLSDCDFSNSTNLSQIGHTAFAGTSLTSINLSPVPPVISLGQTCFSAILPLKFISLPNNIITLPDYVFQYSGITNISLGTGVRNIGTRAFESSKLQYIHIPNNITNISDYAFNDSTLLTKVDFDSGVKNIGSYAFRRNLSLIYMIFPDSVETMGDNVFIYSGSFRKVYFEGNAPNASNDVFSTMSNVTIYYRDGATGFTNPWRGRPTAVWTSYPDLMP